MARKKISKKAREELVQAIGERYRAGNRPEKLRILDEFVAVTAYHRKHAIRLLNSAGARPRSRKPSLSRVYDDAVQEALVVLWEASDRVCGKRLKPLLPILVAALERHGHLQLDEAVSAKVLSASAATLDRLLAGTRASIGREGTTRSKAVPGIRRSIPVRTFADWKEPAPGYMEADLVAHGGESMEGSFLHSLVLTDIASGWTECVALVVRAGALITEAMERLRTTMPFPLRGFDTDNGSEFINELVVAYCTEHGIEFTRSRPYRKNDQAWIEQKNGSVVRRLVGYSRLEGIAAAEVLARLYAASRLFVNFFQPSFKLAEKKRVGSRVGKRYHLPQTPCARLLESDALSEGMKERLKDVALHLDPLRLLDEIRTAQHQLVRLADGDAVHAVSHHQTDLDQFLSGLATAWQDGEVRPTHRRLPKPRRDWRTRKDPLEAVWPGVCAWRMSGRRRTGPVAMSRKVQAIDANGRHRDQLREHAPRTGARSRLRSWTLAARASAAGSRVPSRRTRRASP